MKPIAGNSVVSCYMDAVSLLIMFELRMLSARMRRRDSAWLRSFDLLLWCVTLNCIFPFVYNAMYMQPAPWCHTAAVVAKTLRECLNVVIVFLWLLFLDQKLFGGNYRRSRVFRLTLVICAGLIGLLIVNLFTGIVFTFSAENQLMPRPLLYAIFAVEFALFVFSAVTVRVYDRQSMKIRFLHISPMLFSIMFASGITVFTSYDIGILGYVIGIILLSFSLLSEYRFEDAESGLYNRGYLVHLFNLAAGGKNDIRSALIIEPAGNLEAGFKILRETLHKEHDVIRTEARRFMMFSPIDSRSALQILSTNLEEAVAGHNAEHPDETVQLTVYSRMRTGEEDSFSFLRTTVQDKDAGDPVRGVVSMISELDRLDHELKLAADIQINMLPMIFPPFPERTEFALYASMLPAKEVGGDFYDFFLIDEDHLGLVIADVSGKGIPAALFMMVSKTLIKNQLMSGSDPATTLDHVNQQLYERNSSMMFVTVWLAVLQISTGKGTAGNAGHENPALMRNGGDFEMIKYRHDLALGISDHAKFRNHEFELSGGDCVFVYTDGVPEATNAALEMFGENRLTEVLNENREAGPEELICAVHKALDTFADGAPQFDDTTMLCLKWT